MKSLKKILGVLILLVLIVVGGYVGFMIVTDYRPEPIEVAQIENNKEAKVQIGKEYTITTFNIGYAGMDKDVDFFMDGGTMSWAKDEDKVKENLNGIEGLMKKLNSDFYLLQEVDKKSTRTYKIDEVLDIQENFKDYSTTFTKNFDVPWVPIPFSQPHGNVLAGLMTLSKFNFDNADRYDLPGKENFLRQLGELDRCMLVNREKLDNGKDLVLINIHLSAYDEGGKVRKVQLDFLKEFVNEEAKKGNYVLLGGDWNNELPNTSAKNFESEESIPAWLQRLPEDFFKDGFKIYADAKTPSNRTVERAYVEGMNLRSVIDGFLVSDNIEVSKIEGLDDGFKYSDHNPTTLTFKLK